MNQPGDFMPSTEQISGLIQTPEQNIVTPERLDHRRLLLFASLYAVQGIVVSYFLTFNGRYMRSEVFHDAYRPGGLSITQVGWSQTIATLPLAIKFIFGVAADRYSFFHLGHRRPYIILGLVMQSLGLMGLSLINPVAYLSGFTLMATCAVIGLCLYDVACDAFAVQVTPANDRNRVQGVLQTSRFISTAICGVLFGYLWHITPVSGNAVLWLCAVMPIPVIGYAFSVPEPASISNGKKIGWSCIRIFRKRSLWALLLFSVIYSLVCFGTESVLVFWFAVPFLAFSEKSLGFQSLWRNIGRAIGAIIQTRLARKMSHRSLVSIGLVGLSFSTFLFAFVQGHISAMLIGTFFGITVGWLDVLTCSMAMNETDEEWPATSYALIMAFQNLGTLGSGILASLADGIGFKSAFAIAAAVNLVGMIALFGIAKKPPSRREDEIWTV